MGWEKTDVEGKVMWERNDGVRLPTGAAIAEFEKNEFPTRPTFPSDTGGDDDGFSENVEPLSPVGCMVVLSALVYLVVGWLMYG